MHLRRVLASVPVCALGPSEWYCSLASLVLHLKRWTLLRPTLPAIVEPGRRNIGMPQPLLHLGDVDRA